MRFDWDSNKAVANQQKHKVSFNEAVSSFYDENALVIQDPDHSDEEERFLLLGLSRKLRVLIVCHCYRENEEIIRLISARKANKKEQSQYENQL